MEKNEVAKNRIILARIVDAIKFLGQQGLPLRGHRESLVNDSVNTGNFYRIAKINFTLRRPIATTFGEDKRYSK